MTKEYYLEQASTSWFPEVDGVFNAISFLVLTFLRPPAAMMTFIPAVVPKVSAPLTEPLIDLSDHVAAGPPLRPVAPRPPAWPEEGHGNES